MTPADSFTRSLACETAIWRAWEEHRVGRLPGSGEQWLPVPGYEGRYEVSNLGRVRSLPRTEMTTCRGVSARRVVKGRILKNMPNTDGYATVCLRKGRVRNMARVHRLVAVSFVPGRNPLHRQAAHLDGDRMNARADNLKWVSGVENVSHKRAHGTHPSGEKHPQAKLTEAAVLAIRARARFGNYRELAAEFGISRHTVSDIVRRCRWAHVSEVPHGAGDLRDCLCGRSLSGFCTPECVAMYPED